MNLYGKENLNYLENMGNYEHNSELKRFEGIMKEKFLCGNVRWKFFILLELWKSFWIVQSCFSLENCERDRGKEKKKETITQFEEEHYINRKEL